MDVDCTAGDYCDPAVSLYRRRSSDASVELAATAAVRMAHADVLAGVGIAGAVPDSFRWTRSWRSGPWRRPPLPTRLPQHEPGGAGKVPTRYGRGVWVQFVERREGYVVVRDNAPRVSR